MPRTRQHQRHLQAGPSPRYGDGEAISDAVKTIPDKHAADDAEITKSIAAARQRAAQLQPQAPPGPPPNPMDVGAAAASVLPPVTGRLNAPTARPGVPVTTGLPMGPGAGPEALGPVMAASAANPIWQSLASATGDPYFTELARRTGLGA